MALDILTQDIIIDESTGLTDDDIDSSASTNTTLLYLLSLDDPGGLSSPEVAYQANFVQASASAGETINSVILAQNDSGTPFSTTVGVNSGIRTVDGNYVWLFQDPTHPNVVIGVIGTSDPAVEPDETGPLAFAFGLDPTSNANADLYLVQYVPLFHPDPDQIDERIDLTDKVFASVSGTTVVSFTGQNAAPGNHDFYLINSPTDASKQLLVTGFVNSANATANVSTQGFGVNNQSINPTETLQVDFVTGGNLAAGSGSQIQYGSHLNNVTQAGFTINQITPSNPNLRVDITIKAFDNTGNEQGSDFYDGTTTNAVDIVSVKLAGKSGFATTITADGTYATGSGSVTITGLSGTGNAVTITGLDNVTTVDITTASQMDRLTVTGVDANEGCDITEFHFTSQTPNAHVEQVGSFINFDDSGPTLSITAAPVVGAAEVVEASGAGGQNQVIITPPTFNASAVDGKTTNVTYALTLAGATATGLQTTEGNHAITLVADSASQISGKFDSDGNGSLDETAFTVTLSGTTVTLTSSVALEHSNAPQGAGEDNTLDLNGLIKVVATVTVTDGDEDVVSQQSTSSALSLTIDDTDPTLLITAIPVVGAAEVVEASGAGGQSQATIAAPTFNASAVDGKTTNVSYALALAGGTATGLTTTDGNHAITLVADSASQISGKYDSDGDAVLDATAFTVTLSGTTVTLTSSVALEHSNAPQGAGEDNTLDLNGLINVVATVTVTDGDEDVVSQQSTSSALSLTFDDTDPTLSITAAPVVGAADVGEASGAGGQNQVTITPPTFNASAVDGKTTNVSYALALAGATTTGLQTTEGNHAITLVFDSANQISGQYDSDGDTVLDATAFTVTLSGATVTLTSSVALEHANAPQGVGEDNTLDLSGLINVVATVTVTDGDEDVVSEQSASSGLSLTFNDTDPTITVPFDGDQTGAPGTHETLANTLNATAIGAFGYDMTDKHTAAEYAAGVSDFVDVNGALAGIQIGLTGTVDNAQNPNITQAVATLTAETAASASFNFSFHYDKDPITAGVQDATAGGTLVFDKAADTYTFTLTDVIDGFSFDVLHTNELLAKQPTGNTGHPLIVAEQLTANNDPDPFFVQFTGNSITRQIGFGFNSTGDGAPNGPPTDTAFTQGAHDMVTNANEDWVSATQATNGVAGDTIQKGELLTLRFFEENILSDVSPNSPGGGTERLDPTASASGVVIKFDGIGNSEDLVLILDLKDANGNEVTRAVNVENADLIKGNANIPFPYSTEFTLDNNDALLIIEQNDYTVAGETYQIQGIQIMQSANGLTGNAINLIGATGDNGGSHATTNLTAFDPTDNDVLKIVDIGFVQQTSGTIDANLDFAFQVVDADADQTATQHILVDVS
ncbi:beta strand repeat-containing protein [Ensifer sp. B1-9]|uniref:beta strand repeat-containing protein n=1 Tax=Ensifer sp. B1-9 TaxID=3141455 RepID=UPI003D245767